MPTEETQRETFSQQMSRLSGVPILKDLEQESRTTGESRPEAEMIARLKQGLPEDRYAKPLDLKQVLGSEAVTGLYWHHRRACLVLVTTSDRRISMPKVTFYGIATIVETPTGRYLKLPDLVGVVARLIAARRPN